LYPQSFGNALHMAQSVLEYAAFLVQLYAYCWFGGELTRLVNSNSQNIRTEQTINNHNVVSLNTENPSNCIAKWPKYRPVIGNMKII
jgi:hypothetical protein